MCRASGLGLLSRGEHPGAGRRGARSARNFPPPARACRRASAMGLLTFGLNLTLDGCCDHREMIADDELLRYLTRLMDAAGAMLYGRATYELMESAFPAMARDEKAPRAMREWARKLEAKPKYVVSASRRDFPW